MFIYKQRLIKMNDYEGNWLQQVWDCDDHGKKYEPEPLEDFFNSKVSIQAKIVLNHFPLFSLETDARLSFDRSSSLLTLWWLVFFHNYANNQTIAEYRYLKKFEIKIRS